MRINTRTGSLDLTKRERQTLADCKALLLAIAKHGCGDVAESASDAADGLGVVQRELECTPFPVAPDGEEVKAPY